MSLSERSEGRVIALDFRIKFHSFSPLGETDGAAEVAIEILDALVPEIRRRYEAEGFKVEVNAIKFVY